MCGNGAKVHRPNEKAAGSMGQRPPGSKLIRDEHHSAPVLLNLAAPHFAVESKTRFETYLNWGTLPFPWGCLQI